MNSKFSIIILVIVIALIIGLALGITINAGNVISFWTTDTSQSNLTGVKSGDYIFADKFNKESIDQNNRGLYDENGNFVCSWGSTSFECDNIDITANNLNANNQIYGNIILSNLVNTTNFEVEKINALGLSNFNGNNLTNIDLIGLITMIPDKYYNVIDYNNKPSINTSLTYLIGANKNNLIDNNQSSFSADPIGLNINTYFGFNFSNPVNIRQIGIVKASSNGVGNDATFNFQYSDNGVSWLSMGIFTINSGTNQIEQNYTFDDFGSHKYFRAYYFSGITGGNFWLAEVYLYNATLRKDIENISYNNGLKCNNGDCFSQKNIFNQDLNTTSDIKANSFQDSSGDFMNFGQICNAFGDCLNSGVINTNQYVAQGNSGITDTTSFWMCTDVDCINKCQVQIYGGIITGCV